MRLSIVISLLLLALLLGTMAQAQPVARDVVIVSANGAVEHGQKWAIIIGCNGYDPEQVGGLKVAVADARRVRDTLIQNAGFEPDHVILLTDDGLLTATGLQADRRPIYTTLQGQIGKFVQAHKASDVLLIFFAGHGFHSKRTNKDYLAPLDVQLAALDRTALAVDDLLEQLKASGARQAVLIADACRTIVGRAPPGEETGVGDASLSAARARGVWYLSSCSEGETSQEDAGLGGGVFTWYFAEGLKGAADGCGGGKQDGYVTVTEAQAYAAEKAEAWSRAHGVQVQNPSRSELNVSGGEMVLAVPGPAVALVPPQPQPQSQPQPMPQPATGGQPWERAGTRAGEEITGPDGGAMVWVPAGEFMMGSNDYDYEKPVHKVRITRGFWLGKCEVTNAQYRRFCGVAGRTFPSDSNQGDQHPVVYVNWDDAVTYCRQYGLRLPTEAEWEYAARGAEGREYPWGNDWDVKKCCNDQNLGPGGRTYPVGSFPAGASWCGAWDLAGNAWEWCADWYADDYYGRSLGSDPSGPLSGTFRLLRGGSWSTNAYYCRSAYRGNNDPSSRNDGAGFRAVVVPLGS